MTCQVQARCCNGPPGQDSSLRSGVATEKDASGRLAGPASALESHHSSSKAVFNLIWMLHLRESRSKYNFAACELSMSETVGNCNITTHLRTHLNLSLALASTLHEHVSSRGQRPNLRCGHKPLNTTRGQSHCQTSISQSACQEQLGPTRCTSFSQRCQRHENFNAATRLQYNCDQLS